MSAGIIPEDKPFLPRGILARPVAIALLLVGVGTTFRFQADYLRPGAALDVVQIGLLGIAYLPYLSALPLAWRLGARRRVIVRLMAVVVAALLVGSSVVSLYDAFVLHQDVARGFVFMALPAFQLVGVIGAWVVTRGSDSSGPEAVDIALKGTAPS